jgi:hypothetical protein
MAFLVIGLGFWNWAGEPPDPKPTQDFGELA